MISYKSYDLYYDLAPFKILNQSLLHCRQILYQLSYEGSPSLTGKIPWRRDRLHSLIFLGFPCGSAGKESNCNARDLGSIPGLGRSLSGLENSMHFTVHGVEKSDVTEWLSLTQEPEFLHIVWDRRVLHKYLDLIPAIPEVWWGFT